MTHFFKELYRKFAVFGGALALMAVTTGAGYEAVDWGQAWMPTSLHPTPVIQSCEEPNQIWLFPLSLKAKDRCQLSSTASATAERGQLDSQKTENIF